MSKAGTYNLYGGRQSSVVVELNQYGHVMYCDDMEQLYGTPSESEPHRGDKAKFFEFKNGRTCANQEFFRVAEKID